MKKILVTTFILYLNFFTLSTFAQNVITKTVDLKGNWQSVTDKSYIVKITEKEFIEMINKKVETKVNYILVNSCNEKNVAANNKSPLNKIIKYKDGEEDYCYKILFLNNNSLSLLLDGNDKEITFKRLKK
jgi:hypothetical protein